MVESEPSEHHLWILHIWISLSTKFRLRPKILIFWTNFDFFDQICPKWVFPVKNRKSEQQHRILHVWSSLGTKFQQKLTILILWTKFALKGKWKKGILLIQISLGAKFQLKLTVLIFWTKFAQKGYFQSKTQKMNITIEFYIFELVLVPTFTLNNQLWILGPNLPKKGISCWKWKNWTSPLHFAYSNYFEYQISLYTNNFEFRDQICPKRAFSVKNEKSEYHHWILHILNSLGTKFHFKQTILNFETKFAQKVYFRSKMKKVNNTIEFCIFE